MAQFLKQSTAFTFRIGPFLDSTDGVTAETALTIAQADIQISKAGGAFAQTSAAPTTTHDADGWYQCPLTATDTGTVGTLTVQVVMAGACPVWKDFMVLPANVFDSLMGTDLLDVSATQFAGQTITAAAGVTVLASVGTAATSTAQTGDAFARLGAPAGASVSADVAAVKVDSAAVKAKTDSLTYTVANVLDANIQRINDVVITGNGGTGTEFGI